MTWGPPPPLAAKMTSVLARMMAGAELVVGTKKAALIQDGKRVPVSLLVAKSIARSDNLVTIEPGRYRLKYLPGRL